MTSPQNPGGEIGTKVLLENDRVKLWDLSLAPGQGSSWHRHESWYVTVVYSPGRLRVDFVDGASDVDDLGMGAVHYRDKDSVHRVVNVGDSHYANIIIELKDAG